MIGLERQQIARDVMRVRAAEVHERGALRVKLRAKPSYVGL